MPKLPSPIPHPLSYLDAPGWLREALEWVVGVDWPSGDEKAMRLLAEAWHDAARQVGPLLEESDRAALEAVVALGGPEGEAAQALLTLWRRLGGGPEAVLSQVNELFDTLAEFVDGTANDIEGVKLEFYIELLLMLAELLILAATAAVTGGASLAGAGPVMMATRFAIQKILRRAAGQIIRRAAKKALRDKMKDLAGDRLKAGIARFGLRTVREGMEEGLEELGTTAAMQGYQMSEGNRTGLDHGELVRSFGVGTLAGSVANVTSLGGIRAGGAVGEFGERSLRGAAGEVLADITVGVVTGQGVTWTSMGMAATSGTAGSMVGAGQHALDGRLGLSHDVVFEALSGQVEAGAVEAEAVAGPAAVEAVGVAAEAETAAVEAVAGSEAAGSATTVEAVSRAATVEAAAVEAAAENVRSEAAAGVEAGVEAAAEVRSEAAELVTGHSTLAAGTAGLDLTDSSAPQPAKLPGGPGTTVAATPAEAFAGPLPPSHAITGPAPAVPQIRATHETARPPDPAGSSEPFLVVTPTPAPEQAKPFVPEIRPGVPAAVVDDPHLRKAYSDYIQIGIQRALRTRLLEFVDALIGRTESPRRRRELRDFGISALTQADIRPIADELWTISNLVYHDTTWGFATSGLNDTSTISLATGRDVPPVVDSTRRYGQPGTYNPPLSMHQQDVELAVPRDADGVPLRFADLRGDWLRLINDGGPNADLCRAINCTDVVLSLLDTWMHGRPRVAAPRTYDRFTLDDLLRPLSGEINGAGRIEATTGGTFQEFESDWEGFRRLEGVLREAGHGSCAVLIQKRPNGIVHASTVHNQNGEILYVDAQNPGAALTGRPVGALESNIIVLRQDSTQIDLGTPRGIWSTPGAPDPEGAPSAWSAPGVDPELMFRDPTPEQWVALGITDAGPDVASRTAMIDPRELRFLERSVSPRSGAEAADPVHAVHWGDGTLAAFDTQRVHAAVRAGARRIPVVVHAPSEAFPASDSHGVALEDNLWRLDDGRWVVGGDEGELLHEKDRVPRTWGEAAVFQAVKQDSLLPGILFGTTRPPVVLTEPEPETTTDASYPVDALRQLVTQAQQNADLVQSDLAALGHRLHKLESRIKSFESLARKYVAESDHFGGALSVFTSSHANDVLRFTMELPDGGDYTRSLMEGLAELTDQRRYEEVTVKNFWTPGNRFYGANATLRSPFGQLFEVQFGTRLSLRANAQTHDLYGMVRDRTASPVSRVHALFSMLRANKVLALPEAVPEGLAGIYRQADNGLPKWISEARTAWDHYLDWLRLNDRSLAEIVAEFGLDGGDFPIGARRIGTLRDSDVGILRAL